MKKINFNFKYNQKIGIFTFSFLFFLYLLYLSIPSLYDSGRVQKVLYNKLLHDFGLNISLSSNITYRILPKPHFYIKDSRIFQIQSEISNEIGQVKELKVFIKQGNFFNNQNIDIDKLIISKANFFFKRDSLSYIWDLLNKEFPQKKMVIKKSKLFLMDKDDIVFIYSIKNANFSKKKNNSSNSFDTVGSIFKIPIKIEWSKNLEDLSSITTFKARKVDIDFTNKGIFKEGKYNYENNFNFLNSNFKTKYTISKDYIKFFSKKSLIKNTPISYIGRIELHPFSFVFDINSKSIDLEYILKNNNLLKEIILSKVLLNENINGLIKINTNKIHKSKLFDSGKLYIKFEEGSLNLNNSFLKNNKYFNLKLTNSSFEKDQSNMFLNGTLKFNIHEIKQFYKIFPISKKKRYKRNFKKINFNFSLNLEDSQFKIEKITFLDQKNNIIQSQSVDNFVEDNYQTLFIISNVILFKNYMKKILNIYLDEG